MAARRCIAGCETWPNTPIYHSCPVCLQPTRYVHDAIPIGHSEARHAAFEAHYRRHDQNADPARLQPGEEEARFDVTRLPDDWPVLDQHPAG